MRKRNIQKIVRFNRKEAQDLAAKAKKACLSEAGLIRLLIRGYEPKTYSAYGCPYVQENCDVQKPSDNIIIYGHHMNDGSMFTGLMKYRNKSFWEGHKTITFDTLTDRHQYEVIAVFKTVVYTNSSDSFKYYEFTDAENVAEFDAYVAKCKELFLYDTGVSAARVRL